MLPVATKAASSKFRSVNDPSAQAHQRFLLVDTPGHGKLRYHALDNITRRQNIKGIIYMVDAANISRTEVNSERAGLSEASEFLHDILMLLQKRSTKTTSSRVPHQIPVLIAVNKLDLFTAVPVPLVKTALEEEITRIRESRSKGLLDSGVGMGDDVDIGEDKDWLGDGGGGKFEFSQLREMNVPVVLAGGNVQGSEGVDVDGWWDWMGTNL
ncbi:MAG: hypothetical protein M1833_003002 [Piccolia ochrophora]|nr:MAG: hypothetical protein M1833_003002 [Piccolia ochrophora]